MYDFWPVCRDPVWAFHKPILKFNYFSTPAGLQWESSKLPMQHKYIPFPKYAIQLAREGDCGWAIPAFPGWMLGCRSLCSTAGARGMPEADLSRGFTLLFPGCAFWHSICLTEWSLAYCLPLLILFIPQVPTELWGRQNSKLDPRIGPWVEDGK